MDIVTPQMAIDSQDQLGEGPLWDAERQRLSWLDNATGTIRAAVADGQGGWRKTRDWALGCGTGAAIPRASGGFAVASGAEIFLIDEAGDRQPFVRFDLPDHIALNDAKCDRQGRLWVGTMPHDFVGGQCSLYRVGPDGTITEAATGLGLSNGMDWSADGRTFYYVDSFAKSFDAFDFDPESGRFGNRRSLGRLQPGQGSFDGVCTDREGGAWVAVFGSGEVRRYTVDGTVTHTVRVPTPVPTSCYFGGEDLRDLFVTSMRMSIPDELVATIGYTPEAARRADACAEGGGLFVCRPGVTGIAATLFAG